ncbi:type II secretory pathway pseudopilin PulG [Neorhizobium sp. 2083]|uniref:hypothetical protein n=1 Tax=Neorhizobium sp. 2083 TaxID=2817762 RepID=UPI00285D1523|nr:hypothetical protein [Neorhizobium sp. 2083]MDR6816280.1 type II secretory pathway pseudopilin PulG [Neorhizobium sp. 2083]
MVALMFVLAIVAVLAGIFAVVVRQMAGARRQQYLDELAVDNLACTSVAELERKAERQKALRNRPVRISRKHAHNPRKHRPHAGMLAR